MAENSEHPDCLPELIQLLFLLKGTTVLFGYPASAQSHDSWETGSDWFRTIWRLNIVIKSACELMEIFLHS